MGRMKDLHITVYGGGDEAVAAVERIGRDWREQLEQAASEIERLRAESRWIAVSERLPEEGEPNSILLYLDYRDGYGGQAVGYFLGGNFWLYEDGNITCDKAGVDATHWMPLPEPPAE